MSDCAYKWINWWVDSVIVENDLTKIILTPTIPEEGYAGLCDETLPARVIGLDDEFKFAIIVIVGNDQLQTLGEGPMCINSFIGFRWVRFPIAVAVISISWEFTIRLTLTFMKR